MDSYCKFVFSNLNFQIDLSSLVFEHHHLFSLEHYLAQKVVNSYEKYQEILKRLDSLDLDRRLRMLYEAIDDLKEKLMVSVRKDERDFQARRLQSYRHESRLVREKRDEESKNHREAIKALLARWKALRDVRRQQGYHNTDVRILIHKVCFLVFCNIMRFVAILNFRNL